MGNSIGTEKVKVDIIITHKICEDKMTLNRSSLIS